MADNDKNEQLAEEEAEKINSSAEEAKEQQEDDNTKDEEEEDADYFVQKVLASIAQRAREEVKKSLTASTVTKPSETSFLRLCVGDTTSAAAPTANFANAFQNRGSFPKLVQEGAKWKSPIRFGDVTVHRLTDIKYGTESSKQSLDLYLPQEEEEESTPAATTNNETEDITSASEQQQNQKKRPVYIHIHGGGWSRGDKASPFYGGPAMCQNAAASGCLAVAIGYRLGEYPGFLYDAANAIQWVLDHMDALEGDVDNVFLSGHSAGGHIASLLLLRRAMAARVAEDGTPNPSSSVVPNVLEILPVAFKFRGLILVSGVYDLFSPMRKNLVDAKNKWFTLAYVIPAFGTDEHLRREASPLLILHPDKETSVLGTAARHLTRGFESLRSNFFPSERTKSQGSTGSGGGGSVYFSTRSIGTGGSSSELDVAMDHSNMSTSSGRSQPKEEPMNLDLPSTMILNATLDMGLQENGQLFFEALSNHSVKDVRYQIIPGSDHASICWNDTTCQVIADFCQSKLTEECHVRIMSPADRQKLNDNHHHKQHRGKRDRILPNLPMTIM